MLKEEDKFGIKKYKTYKILVRKFTKLETMLEKI